MNPFEVKAVAGVKRRRQISSDISTSTSSSVEVESPPSNSLMSIDEFMHHKDPYRIAPTYQITTPWPFRQGPATEVGDALFANIETECRKILTNLNIKPASIVMRSIWTKGEENGAQDCFIVDTKDDTTTSWTKAAVEIYKVISNAELKAQNFKVEIRNTARMYADTSSCLPNDKELLDCIRDVEQNVKEVLREKLPHVWTSLGFYMRSGKFNNSAPTPTAIVYVRPGAKQRFELIEEQLSEAVKSTKFPRVVLNVEIMPGEILLANPQHDPSLPKPIGYLRLRNTTPFNGVSIGITGPGDNPVESGSLGGWLKLTHKKSGKVYLGFLTCYHCIEKGDQDNKADNDFSGIGLDDLPESMVPEIGVVWPSIYDAKYTMSVCMENVQANTASAGHFRCIGILNQLKAAGIFGKVRFASGHEIRTASGARLDWAFIESSSSFQQNKPPPARPDQEMGIIEYEPDQTSRIVSWTAPKAGDWVIRSGRSSLRQGCINEINRTVNWENHPESTEMDVGGLYDDFGDAGDSGSWVVNQNFELVGVMFGVDSRGTENFAIITPIQDLIQDIENRTGCTVSLP